MVPLWLFVRAAVTGSLTDIRGWERDHPELFDPDPSRYPAAQTWARERREEGVDGVAYASVRKAGGQCTALFRPRIIHACRIVKPLNYLWNGSRIVGWA